MMAGEKNFEKRVENYLISMGIYQAGTPKQKIKTKPIGWFTKIWGGGFQKSGIPDLLLCINGIFISCELKDTYGKASQLQKINTQRINEANGIGIILYPEGFEEFKSIVKGVIDCKYHIQELKHLKDVNISSKCVILMN